MTLEEKAKLCSGKDTWHLKSVSRLNISEITVSDGPHGLRKQEQESDHLGINDSKHQFVFLPPVLLQHLLMSNYLKNSVIF